MQKQIFILKLQSVQDIAPQVKHFSFSFLLDQAFHFIPGQFICLHIPFEGTILRRSYSLANPPGPSPLLELAASYVPQGAASDYLFKMKIGDTIEASGPLGRLILRDECPKRYILIATGTGVTPYRSMLPELANRLSTQLNLEVILLFGVRTSEDLLYREDFENFSRQHPRFQWQVCYSRPAPILHLPYENKGYVSLALESLILSPLEDIVYLCGNPNMVDDVSTFLYNLGFSPERVRREKYVSSKSTISRSKSL